MAELWFVRCWLPVRPDGREVALGEEVPDDADLVVVDEGPWDRLLAEQIIADIGHDGSIPRGAGRTRVMRSVLVAIPPFTSDCSKPVTAKQMRAWLFLRWQAHQPGYEH